MLSRLSFYYKGNLSFVSEMLVEDSCVDMMQESLLGILNSKGEKALYNAVFTIPEKLFDILPDEVQVEEIMELFFCYIYEGSSIYYTMDAFDGEIVFYVLVTCPRDKINSNVFLDDVNDLWELYICALISLYNNNNTKEACISSECIWCIGVASPYLEVKDTCMDSVGFLFGKLDLGYDDDYDCYGDDYDCYGDDYDCYGDDYDCYDDDYDCYGVTIVGGVQNFLDYDEVYKLPGGYIDNYKVIRDKDYHYSLFVFFRPDL